MQQENLIYVNVICKCLYVSQARVRGLQVLAAGRGWTSTQKACAVLRIS